MLQSASKVVLSNMSSFSRINFACVCAMTSKLSIYAKGQAYIKTLDSHPPLSADEQRRPTGQWPFLSQACRFHSDGELKLNYSRVENAIQELDSQNLDSLELLEELSSSPKFSPKKRLELLNKLWIQVLKNNVLLEPVHFNLKLKCYLRCKHKIAPKEFKRELIEAGVDFNEEMLKLLLAVVAEHGDPGYVSTVVTSMKSRNLTADDSVFASLIIAHAVRGDMASARQVIQTMKECRVEPGEKTYGALMQAAVIAGDYAALHTAKSTAQEKGLLSAGSILAVLDTLVRSGKLHLLPSMETSVKACPTEEVMNVAVSLVYSGFASGGYLVFKLMPNLSPEQYTEFIRTMFEAQIPVSKLNCVCGDMVTDGAYDRALFDVLEMVLKGGSIPDGLKVLQACKDRGLSLRQHYFWPLISSASNSEGEQGVYNILNHMTTLGCPADADTLTEMVLSRLSLEETDCVLQRLRDVTQMSLPQILDPFLSHAVRCGFLPQALAISERYRDSIRTMNIRPLLRALASGYSSTGNHVGTVKFLRLLQVSDVSEWLSALLSGRKRTSAKDLVHLLEILKKEGCFITVVGHRWLYRNLSQSRTLSSDVDTALRQLVREKPMEDSGARRPPSNIPHPDEMTVEELDCHLIELKAKGMNTRGALRRLMFSSCRAGDVEKARKAYQQLLEGGMAESPGILAALLVANVKAGLPDDAVSVLQKLKSQFPKFSIDCFKIMDLATLLVKSRRIDEAAKLLKNHTPSYSTIKIKSTWEKNAWELLTAVQEHEGVSTVDIFFNILISCDYSVPTNVICGPLVKAHLKSGDVEGAVDTFSKLALKYNITPLQVELMQAVIASDKVHLLNGLVDAAEKVHGRESARASLVMALAHHGDSSILRQYLTSGNIDLGSRQLKNQISRAVDLGQLDSLKILLIAGLDLPRMDVDHIVALTLQHYHRKGDSESALTYWKELEALGYNVSDKHKSSLASLVASTAKT